MRKILIALMTFAVASPALAASRDDYKAAIEALAAGNASQARELLDRAIGMDPQAKKPVIGRAYLPHYQLGRALYALGDCRGALAAWRESERQGAIKKAKDELVELGGKRSDCRDRIRRFDTAMQEAQSEIDLATETATRVGLLESDEVISQIWEEGEPSLKTQQFEALRFLWEARNELREAQDSDDDSKIGAAKELSRQAISALEALELSAAEQRDSVLARRQDQQQRLERALSNAESVLRATSGPADSAPGVSSLRTRLERLVADGRRDTERTATETRSLSERLGSLTNGLRRATVVPPEELQIAAASFLNGDYSTVIELLQEFGSDDERTAAQICLLRSASYHALERLHLAPPPLPPPPEELEALEELPIAPEPAAEELESEPISPAVQVLLDCPAFDDAVSPGGRYLPPSYAEVLERYRLLREQRELEAAESAAEG